MNLLKETIRDIESSGHTIENIIFIGSEDSGHCCSWDEFMIIANVDYDSGFGMQYIASDLIIVFSDGSKMWRGEYDGAEEWVYSKPFVMPAIKKGMSSVIGDGWQDLSEINSSNNV